MACSAAVAMMVDSSKVRGEADAMTAAPGGGGGEAGIGGSSGSVTPAGMRTVSTVKMVALRRFRKEDCKLCVQGR